MRMKKRCTLLKVEVFYDVMPCLLVSRVESVCPGPIWTGAENLAHAGNFFFDCPGFFPFDPFL
jgi:hypothetical protein